MLSQAFQEVFLNPGYITERGTVVPPDLTATCPGFSPRVEEHVLIGNLLGHSQVSQKLVPRTTKWFGRGPHVYRCAACLAELFVLVCCGSQKPERGFELSLP